MWILLFWKIFLFLLPIVLGVAKSIIQPLVKAVQDAEAHADWTGEQKKDYVLAQLKAEFDFSKVSVPLWALNLLIEACVGSVKTTK